MEMDQTPPEIPDKAATSDEELGPNNNTQTRYYECTFCKRGFSNAEALCGHVNIHRKVKAKLKQPFSARTSNIPPQFVSSLSPNPSNTTLDTKWPAWFLREHKDVKERDKFEEIQQLPLFVENPMIGSIENQCPNVDKGLSSNQGSLTSELDLELRLGPDQTSSAMATATNTRKFF